MDIGIPIKLQINFNNALKTGELNLKDENIKDCDLERFILPFLEKNNNITKLNLSNNLIESDGAIALANNKTIKTLILNLNQIKDEGVMALAQNNLLEELHLYDPIITAKGALSLFKNDTIKRLRVMTGNYDVYNIIIMRKKRIERKKIVEELIKKYNANSKNNTVFPFPTAGGHIVIHELVANYCL